MPVFYQHTINENTRLAVWQITEPENFFLERVSLQREITHPHKRLQHLAGRYLLKELFTDFPVEEIAIATTRKPFLKNERYHFSISHCNQYAAALVSNSERVGVDIELITSKIEKVAPKFLNEAEKALIEKLMKNNRSASPGFYAQLLTMLWSCKEAVFKWYGDGQVDFKRHIILQNVQLSHALNAGSFSFLFSKMLQPVVLLLHAEVMNNLVISWVHTNALFTDDLF